MQSLSSHIFNQLKIYAPMDAIRLSGRSITYQELNSKALTLAAALIEAGANSEAVGIVGQRKASSYFGVLGTIFAGCYYTPINPKYSEERLLSILRDAKIRFLIGDKNDLQLIEPLLSRANTPSIKAILLPEGQCGQIGQNKWQDERSLNAVRPLKSPIHVSPDNLAYLLYTSGSTGSPKGVQVTHSNVLAFLHGMSNLYKLEIGFRASQTFDLSFDPSVSDMFFTWTQGGVLCVLPEEEILLPYEYIKREKINFWNSVPSIVRFMDKMGHLSPGNFPDLTHSMFCGEQFPQQLANAWSIAAPNSTIENLYGPTEATIYISRYVYGEFDRKKIFKNSIIPIGTPFPGHEFGLIDDSGELLSHAGVGEIIFKGPQITNGYLNDFEKTDHAFVRFDWDLSGSRWYKSGDIGFFNEDGNLECIGRKDSQIKLGGRRIEIGEIEAVLARYPILHDAIVVPLRDINKIVIGCVAFTLNEVSNLEQNSIRKESLKFIEKIFFPKTIITLSAFPLSPSGKIDRRALEAHAEDIMAASIKVGS